MNRRHFLFTAAAPAYTLFQRSSSRGVDVAIVGAGLAGLRAADLLRRAGRTVVVFEARGLPGGRVRTIHRPLTGGLYGEAGATRISGSHKRVLQLAGDYKLALTPFGSPNGSSLVTIGGRTVRSPDQLMQIAANLDLKADEIGLAPSALLQRYAGDPVAAANAAAYDRVTWPEWLQSRGASPGAISLMTIGGDSRQVSALYVLKQLALLQDSDQYYKIQGGMDRLPRAMASALHGLIHFNAPVVRVDQTRGKPRVEYVLNSSRRSIDADHVIFAMPLPLLRQIDVQPAWPADKARAIAELPYFPAVRFLLETKTRFWERDGSSGTARTDDPAEIWDAAYDRQGDAGLLGATAGGQIGDRVGTLTDDQTVKFGLDLVSRTFPRLRAEYRKGTAIRWAREPWSRGAFLICRPGQMTSILPAAARAEGRLHFAGEHTSSWMSWMEGALESGERAVREILSAE